MGRTCQPFMDCGGRHRCPRRRREYRRSAPRTEARGPTVAEQRRNPLVAARDGGAPGMAHTSTHNPGSGQ
eukprot:296718-Prymnesium_polylepis.1